MRIAYLLLLFFLISCEQKAPLKTTTDILSDFYIKHKDYNFEPFKCFIISDTNRKVGRRGDEYDVIYYSNCEEKTDYPLRGNVRYKNNRISYSSDKLEQSDLPKQLLSSFRELELSSINFKNTRQIVMSPVPEIVIMKRCGPADPGYLSLDQCWHYKFLK